MANKTIHILRYGTVAERAHLEKALSAYDYLSINGNTAAYVSSAISKFIVAKFFSNENKGYFIDPITYAFQDHIDLLKSKSKVTGESKIKKSVVKLIEEYGAPVTNILGNAPVHISDLSLNSYDFCRRVLDFQYSLVYKHIQENSLDSYLKYVSNSSLQEDFQQLHPKFLIAPYFYLDDTSSEFDQWLSLNRKFAELSIEISKNLYNKKDIFVQLVINKSVLTNSVAIEKIAQTYKKLAIAGLTIWVDDLNEQEASLQELQGFVNLLSQLPSIPKYNMYGGYFSVLLTHKSIGLLEGVSHGLEYGESRKVIQ